MLEILLKLSILLRESSDMVKASNVIVMGGLQLRFEQLFEMSGELGSVQGH